MKITTPIILSASLLLLISCSENKSDTAGQGNTSTVPATGATQTLPSATNAPATKVALNPEHGQPGHRCDIEVGAPLDLPARPNLSTPATVTPIPNQTPVAPGTNPPHGQPGHDCGIPVGAPLNK